MTAAEYSALFAGLSALAAVAAVVLGVLNLRQARRGPAKVPAWSVDRPKAGKATLVLVNEQGAGPAYDVDIEPGEMVGFRGETHYDRVDPGQTLTMTMAFTLATAPTNRKITVTYRDKPRGSKRTWTSSVPG